MNKRDVCYALFLVIREYDNCHTFEHCIDINKRLGALPKLLAEAFQIPFEMADELTDNPTVPPLSTMSFCEIIERFEQASKHFKENKLKQH